MIVSAIDLTSLSLDLFTFESISKISILTNVLISLRDVKVNNEFENDVKVVLEDIKQSLSQYHYMYMDGFKLFNDELIVYCLDKGVKIAFVDFPIGSENFEVDEYIDTLKSFPRTRIGLSIELNDNSFAHAVSPATIVTYIQSQVAAFQSLVEHFLFRFTTINLSFEQCREVISLVIPILGQNTHHSVNVYFNFPSAMTPLELATLASQHDSIHVLARSGNSQIPSEHSVDVLHGFINCLKTDRSDGLYTTVVCDEQGVCLGLVYSNIESIRAAVTEKRGIYWSRSRSSIWRKGDTSGMFQELLAVDYDCDGDALRFIVKQRGEPPAFCHLLTKTCWGEARGIQKLEEMLIDRKKAAPPGSYTKRLFDDPKLLQMKLLEEVQELVEATEPDHIAAEAADVLYFMMTRCVAGGVGLSDIESHLERRSLKISRRPGNAKEWRNRQADAILSQAKDQSAGESLASNDVR